MDDLVRRGKLLEGEEEHGSTCFKEYCTVGCPYEEPDLNPIEMFWGWIRKRLRSMDLVDLRRKRPTLDRAAYIARVKSLMRSQRAQTVAKNCAAKFRKTCQQVVVRNGAAADN